VPNPTAVPNEVISWLVCSAGRLTPGWPHEQTTTYFTDILSELPFVSFFQLLIQGDIKLATEVTSQSRAEDEK
jgi:hypothetical protein